MEEGTIERRITELTRDAYSPYGDVFAATPEENAGVSANQGTATRFTVPDAFIQSHAPAGQANVSVFRVSPWCEDTFEVRLLEKHPRSTQIFVPMNAVQYLAVVALGGDTPDLSTLAAFRVPGNQAISYHPGVWHHPMIALERETDFVAMVYEQGGDYDCEVRTLDEQEWLRLHIA